MLKFACYIGKGDFTFKAEKLDAIKCIHDGKDVFLWLSKGFGKSICYETLLFVFNYKHSDSGTSSGCCHVTPCVSDNESLRRINTLQAVYLLWLFLCITTMCNLYIIRLVHQRFPESVVHAQTVDTRPLSLLPRGLGTRLDKLMLHDFLIFMHMRGVGCKVEDGGRGGASVRGIDWGRKDM